MNGNQQEVIMGVATVASKDGELETREARLIHTLMPREYTDRHLDIITNDCRLLAKFIADHPNEVRNLLNLLSKGQIEQAISVSKELGFSEDYFASGGGGITWLGVTLVALRVFLWSRSVGEGSDVVHEGDATGDSP